MGAYTNDYTTRGLLACILEQTCNMRSDFRMLRAHICTSKMHEHRRGKGWTLEGMENEPTKCAYTATTKHLQSDT